MNLFIIPTNFEKESQIIYIKHPRTNLPSPFLVTANKIYELLEVDRNPSSFLFARQVISNGKLFLAVEFHPLFLALPLILERETEYYSLDGLFDDTDLKPIELLVKPYFYLVCQPSKVSGYAVWSYDEKKMKDWLCSKISKLILYMKELEHKKQKDLNNEQNNENNLFENKLVESAFDILRHYVKASVAQILKNELQERYPGTFQSFSSLKSFQLNQSQKKSSDLQSTSNSNASLKQISSGQNLTNKNQIKKEQSKKTSQKGAETKKKKNDIKISKCPIESFFAPQKKK